MHPFAAFYAMIAGRHEVVQTWAQTAAGRGRKTSVSEQSHVKIDCLTYGVFVIGSSLSSTLGCFFTFSTASARTWLHDACVGEAAPKKAALHLDARQHIICAPPLCIRLGHFRYMVLACPSSPELRDLFVRVVAWHDDPPLKRAPSHACLSPV